jgi:hypothetical protein
MHLRDASFELINNYFRELISPGLHVSASPSALKNDHVRALHPVQIIDPFFKKVFYGDIIDYTTAFIGRIRFIHHLQNWFRRKFWSNSSYFHGQ